MADDPDTTRRAPSAGDGTPQVGRAQAAAVFFVSLIVVLAGVEAASRALMPNGYRVWPPGFQMKFDAGDAIEGVSFPGLLTINSIGMRGDEPIEGDAYRPLIDGAVIGDA